MHIGGILDVLAWCFGKFHDVSCVQGWPNRMFAIDDCIFDEVPAKLPYLHRIFR